MTVLSSIGDLSRSHQLRQSQALLKTRLDTLSKEIATGTKADPARALNGDISRVTQIDARLTMLKTYAHNSAEADGMLSAVQHSLSNLHSISESYGQQLLSSVNSGGGSNLSGQIQAGKHNLRAAIETLNREIGGRQLFSGTNANKPALPPYDDFMALITSAVGDATTADEIAARISARFDAPRGGNGFVDHAFLGTEAPIRFEIAPGQVAENGINAASPELRETLKNLAIMAYAADTPGIEQQELEKLAQKAGVGMLRGAASLVDAQAAVGQQQHLIASAQARNEAESGTITLARAKLISADPYETATALQEVETRMQALYAITSRLSRLSLADFLR